MHDLTSAQRSLLRDVLCGDRSGADRAVATARRDAAFARHLDALLATGARLHAAARVEREVLASAGDRATRRPRRAWLAAIAGAAAAVSVAVWIATAGSSAPAFLGSGIPIAMVAPDYACFAFAATPPPGGGFEVTVDVADGQCLARARLTAPRWQAPAERAGWPPAVHVLVRMLDAQGDEQARGEARFERRSR